MIALHARQAMNMELWIYFFNLELLLSIVYGAIMILTNRFWSLFVVLIFLSLVACKSSSSADETADPAENTADEEIAEDVTEEEIDEASDDTATSDDSTEDEEPQTVVAGECDSYTYDDLGVETGHEIISYEYDSWGNHTAVYQDSDGDGIYTSLAEYTYSDDGSQLMALSLSSLDPVTQEATLQYQAQYEYDSYGNEVLYIFDSATDGIGEDDTDSQYENTSMTLYNLNQQLLEERSYEDGVLSALTVYTYNADDLLDTKTSDSNGDGTDDHLYSYSYDAEGRISVINYEFPSNILYNYSYTYTYAGNIVDYYIHGGFSCTYNSTTYDSPEYEQIQSYYYWVDSDCSGTLDVAENLYEYTYTYPDADTTELDIELNGVLTYSETESTTVDADGNTLFEESQDSDADGDIDSYTYEVIMPPEFTLESGEDYDNNDILDSYTSCSYTYE